MILAIRTDNPMAELYILNQDGKVAASKKWQAHRQLGETLLTSADEVLSQANCRWLDIEAAIYYSGPGSFTGLRIGAAFVNALSVNVVSVGGEDWIEAGLEKLLRDSTKTAVPNYGSPAKTTEPKK